MKSIITFLTKTNNMFKFKTLLIVLVFAIPTLHYGQYTDVINSNRPGETMSAFSVGKSVIQVETGIYGIKQKLRRRDLE